ncbi:MAG: archaeosortase H [Promethearchaeota archaeon]
MQSIILIAEFFIGLIISLNFSIIINLLLIGAAIILLLFHSLIIIRSLIAGLPIRKKIWAIVMIILNSIFSFVIGFTTPQLQTESKYNFAFLMLPLLIILELVIIDKYFKDLKYIRNPKLKEIDTQVFSQPVIEFEGKKYIFSIRSLIFLGIGAPLLALGIYFFFDQPAMYWLHEITVKQTAFFLNLFFNMDVSAVYTPGGIHEWAFSNGISFETFCTGIQAICVFAGIILFIPHSKDKRTNRDIIWRKAKSLVISSLIFYIVNIIRMLIQIELYNIGYPWESIHVSISAASSFIAAIIILLLHKWIPEFIISIIYTGTLFKKRFGKKSKVKEKIPD